MRRPPLPRQALSRKLAVLNCFDPWSSPTCTCGPKLSLDPYTGCPGGCAYCYAATYLWRYWGPDKVRPKQDLLRRLQRDLERLHTTTDPDLAAYRGAWVTVSNSSDPYPTVPAADEGTLGLTRQSLAMLVEAGMGVLLQTKSDLLRRDLDVLPQKRTVVGVTLTTLRAESAARLEPGMPAPQQRLEAVREAAAAGFPVLVRLDPLIPGVNTAPEELRELVAAVATAGARHLVSSTVKLQPSSRKRLREAFPAEMTRAEPLFTESQGRGGYHQLPSSLRGELLGQLGETARARGLSFAVCREADLSCLSTRACDGRDLSGEDIWQSSQNPAVGCRV